MQFAPSVSLQVYSPLEQFSVYAAARLFGVTLTSVGLYGLLCLLITGSFGLLTLYHLHLLPAKNSTFEEVLADSTGSFIPPVATGFSPFVFSLLCTLAVSNLLGNLPFGYASPTSLPFSLGGSLTLWVWLVFLHANLSHLAYFDQFIPAGTPLPLTLVLAPIETVSYSARAGSLGVRLFSNILAGHTLLAILAEFLQSGTMGGILSQIATFIALIPLCCIIALEIAVSIIQSYVFCVLLVSYIQGAI
jgi:F-type H+-transporting ATPase subunit a